LDTFIVNVKNVTAATKDSNNNPTSWNKQNGLKIVFQTDEIGVTLPTFTIFLDSDGQIGFSNGTKIIKPFS
jgi:hypothetical protein